MSSEQGAGGLDDKDDASCYRLEADRDYAWRSLLAEWESLRLDDSLHRSKQEQWLHRMEAFMVAHVQCPERSAYGFSLSSKVALYDLDIGPLTEVEVIHPAPQSTTSNTMWNEIVARVSTTQAGPMANQVQDSGPSLPHNNSQSEEGAAEERSHRFQVAWEHANRIVGRSSATLDSSVRSRMRAWVEDLDGNKRWRVCTNMFTLSFVALNLSLQHLCTEGLHSDPLGGCYVSWSLDVFINCVFTIEVLVYAAVYPWSYLLKSVYFWLDLVAPMPFYVRLIVGWNADENAPFEFVTVCVPILWLLKITRRSFTWCILVKALKAVVEPIAVPALFVAIVMTFFSGVLYWTEKYLRNDDMEREFMSVPDALWFSLCTISTVGYGDKIPRTYLGKVLSVVMIAVGVCCFAMPLAVVGGCFCSVWEQRDIILTTEKLKRMLALAGVSIKDAIELFTAFDLDRSGQLELNELGTFFGMLGIKLPKQDLVKMFDEIDIEKSGRISLDEFREYLGYMNEIDFTVGGFGKPLPFKETRIQVNRTLPESIEGKRRLILKTQEGGARTLSLTPATDALARPAQSECA